MVDDAIVNIACLLAQTANVDVNGSAQKDLIVRTHEAILAEGAAYFQNRELMCIKPIAFGTNTCLNNRKLKLCPGSF